MSRGTLYSQHAVRRRFVLGAALVAAIASGCNLLGNLPGGSGNNNSNPPVIDADNNPQQAANPPATDINGVWQFAGSGALSGACVTIVDRKISIYDVDEVG